MIQRPASGTFDLELGKLTHAGEKSFAISTSAFFQHLQIPFANCFIQVTKSPELVGALCFLAGIKKPALWPAFSSKLPKAKY
ncbi:hypothetical protein POF45_00995 [Pseudomonas sp. 681]|uniref:Uncharacterized protein n=1 Tax=Pseudomonas fungipugnans TaxID=3024217 RepID=A0ABT6QGS2_9PSED|nr:hypothetical protein [Pseudomonas sp. 681]MDI2590008.1 hypothetical protein [Pseudomonas sp. 681]